MRTVAFVVVTVVLSVLGVVRVGRWALAETPDPVLTRVAPATTTTSPSTSTTSTTTPGFIDGPVVTGHRRAAATTTTVTVAGRTWTWDQLAACEAGGRWTATRGVYQGGLQFDARTWDRYVTAFPGFPADAQLATRDQQIAVAEQVLLREGPRAWPTCGPRIGLTGTVTDVSSYPAGPPIEPD